ncbi:MAG: hypothetical protein NTZ05_23410, partial [Chloroflexi bacterium]|nr:hypothetical protein [Chloroflexota bacterium]
MADIDLFGQTYTAILQKIMGGGNPNFQLIYPFADWWWPTAPARQISPQAYNFVSQVPQWSTVGRYNPAGTNLLDAYREVLYQVNLSVPPAKQQQVKDATDQRMIAHNQWGSDYAAMITAWDTMLANTPSTFPAPDFGKWQTDSGWTATLAVDTADVTKTDETLANIIAQENPEYTTALEAIKAPADIHTSKAGWMLTDQGGGNLVSVPSWTIEDSGPDWVARLTKGGSPITINLDSSVSSSALSESWAEGS